MRENCEVTRLYEERNIAKVRNLLLLQHINKAAYNQQL